MDQREHVVPICTSSNPDFQSRLQKDLYARLGLGRDVPFASADLTAGTENELATAVTGRLETVDFPNAVRHSPHLRGLSPSVRQALDQWLAEQADGVWEHSWLRLDYRCLHPVTRARVEQDLSTRTDRADFDINGTEIRVPASYVLKLALVDACATLPGSAPLRAVAERVGGSFLNDNTAPEILSTHIVSGWNGSLGQALGQENAQRFLLVQLLTAYANQRFALAAGGQPLTVYGAPTPPRRLRALSRLLPADFYRELIMNPCLAGFTDGAAKRQYMHLCHETLSRSRQHARVRLTGSGISASRVIERLVCDTSLLNNGTHLSLGSRLLGNAFADPEMAGAEKYIGDLASKVIEHFLPLFVGLYSAAPARFSASELKPEQALGFLPNELSSPFLRMTWQSWKRKAGLLSAIKGDVVPDARLIDYFAALPSLPGQAALNGQLGNGERLKQLLESQGLYSGNMTVYALYRLRERARMGFSGFEGRHYSLFPSFLDDLGPAADLQALITAVAYRHIARGDVTHAHIPDDPETESERRQLFFAQAIGLPVAYVRRTTRNRFLLRVLAHTHRTRPSKRYPQYYKVYLEDYLSGLARLLAEDAEPVLEASGRRALDDLRQRLTQPQAFGAAGSMVRGILEELGESHAMDVEAGSFNRAAEQYYRETLRARQLAEGVEACSARLLAGQRLGANRATLPLHDTMRDLTGGRTPHEFISLTRRSVLRETADPATLRAWIGFVLVNVAADSLEG